jgi:hypothetical protein
LDHGAIKVFWPDGWTYTCALVGVTGCGETRAIREAADEYYCVYFKPDSTDFMSLLDLALNYDSRLDSTYGGQ